jgi:hypothetical protein
MKISFRLNAREKNVIFLTRLDPLLCFKLESEILPINDLMGGLILFTDWSLNFPYFRREFSHYFSVKKNVHIAEEEEEFNQNISDYKTAFSSEIENSKIEIEIDDRDIDQIYYVYDIDFGTTVSVDSNIAKILDGIIEGKNLGLKEANISKGEILKGITYLLTNNLVFQISFREYMFLGHLYDLSYTDMGNILDGHYENIENRKLLSFKDHFNKDFEKWDILLEIDEFKYAIGDSKKTRFKGVSFSQARSFYLREAMRGFNMLDHIIFVSARYDLPYLTLVTAAWNLDSKKNESLIDYSISAMRNKLTFIKGILDKI